MFDLSSVSIERSKRTSIAIAVLPDNSVVIKAPHLVPKFMIDRFVSEHEDWIVKQLAKRKNHAPVKPKKYEHGEAFLYLGSPHLLDIGSYTQIEAQNGKLLYPRALTFRIKTEIPVWYQNQAKKLITERVFFHAKEMGVTHGPISFSDTKSKWGSCTYDDRLQFNWRLIMAPLIVLNYVVVHELVHTVEKNHSDAFWRKVAARNPSYKQQRLWLKKYGDTLIL